MNPPIYVEGESVTKFQMKLNKYLTNLKKDDYNIILQFFNTWLEPYGMKIGSLTEFKNFSQLTLDKHTKHNKKTVKKNYKILEKLQIKPNYDSDNETESIPEYEIITFISKLLKRINFKLNKKKFYTKNDQEYFVYWITMQ